jgi:uncharacterized protein (TIGR02271 family)
MNSKNTVAVFDQTGRRGTIDLTGQRLVERRPVEVNVDDWTVIVTPEMLRRRQDGSYYLPLSFEELRALGEDESDEVNIPVIEERLRVDRREVTTGGVRITKRVTEEERVVEEPRFDEEVQVERVPVNRVVEEPVQMRQEGDTLIIPMHEERLVLRKELVLREELRITKRRQKQQMRATVSVRKEEPVIERMDGEQAEEEQVSMR